MMCMCDILQLKYTLSATLLIILINLQLIQKHVNDEIEILINEVCAWENAKIWNLIKAKQFSGITLITEQLHKWWTVQFFFPPTLPNISIKNARRKKHIKIKRKKVYRVLDKKSALSVKFSKLITEKLRLIP